MVNNAVMQFADRAFLARESMACLEAALPASMLAFLFLGFFQSTVAYSGTFVAQYHGAGNAPMARAAAKCAMKIAAAASVLCLAAIPLGNIIFAWAGDSPEVVERESAYFSVSILGGYFLLAQMAMISYFTGIGNTRLAYRVNLAGNLANVVLDPFFIFESFRVPLPEVLGGRSPQIPGLGLGMAGAALATVASMSIQWGILLMKMSRERCPAVSSAEMSKLLKSILRFGIPSGAYTILNVLSFTVFVFFTGRAGDVAFAVSNACFSVNYLLIAPVEGFAVGAQTLVGHARGRGDDREASRVALRTTMLAAGFVAILSVAVLLAHRPILSVFAPDDNALAGQFHSLGSVLFAMMAAWQIFDAADVTLSGALKGAGDTKFVFWWMLGAAFGFWLPLVWLVSAVRNTMPALWATMIVYVAVVCAGSAIRWKRGKWKKISLAGK